MDNNSTMAQRLRAIRGTLTQAEFAHRLGIHKNTLGRYERGESEPDTQIARLLCTAFGVQPHWLLFGSGAEPSPSPDRQSAATTLPGRVSLIDELESIRRDNNELRQDLRELRNENREIRQENRDLIATIRELLQENGELRGRITESASRAAQSITHTGPDSLHSV
ncbi:MAG: helix-turn-helix domain-containing protein [Acidobacteriota bacterium]